MKREMSKSRSKGKGDKRREREDELMPLMKKGAKYLEGVTTVDYKDAELLRKFMTERGKISPRRIVGTSAKQQRQVQQAIRRARVLGLLP